MSKLPIAWPYAPAVSIPAAGLTRDPTPAKAAAACPPSGGAAPVPGDNLGNLSDSSASEVEGSQYLFQSQSILQPRSWANAMEEVPSPAPPHSSVVEHASFTSVDLSPGEGDSLEVISESVLSDISPESVKSINKSSWSIKSNEDVNITNNVDTLSNVGTLSNVITTNKNTLSNENIKSNGSIKSNEE